MRRAEQPGAARAELESEYNGEKRLQGCGNIQEWITKEFKAKVNVNRKP